MNEAANIARALAQIPGIGTVTRGWPKQAARLPCAVVTLEEESAEDTRDNALYLTRLTYSIRVFAQTMEACDALTDSVGGVMEELGYTRDRTLEMDGETAQQKTSYFKLTQEEHANECKAGHYRLSGRSAGADPDGFHDGV